MLAFECAFLSAWYSSRPELRRLRANRDTEGLRVLDSNEIHPAWLANRDVWIDELP